MEGCWYLVPCSMATCVAAEGFMAVCLSWRELLTSGVCRWPGGITACSGMLMAQPCVEVGSVVNIVLADCACGVPLWGRGPGSKGPCILCAELEMLVTSSILYCSLAGQLKQTPPRPAADSPHGMSKPMIGPSHLLDKLGGMSACSVQDFCAE